VEGVAALIERFGVCGAAQSGAHDARDERVSDAPQPR
jgi:hypothetical protein